jgi:hypothetical protein
MKKVFYRFLSPLIVLAFLLPTSALADGTVSIIKINDLPPSATCLVSPIKIQVVGVNGTQNGGNYYVDINWGDTSIPVDGVDKNIPTGGKGDTFDFTRTHTMQSVSVGLSVILHHSNVAGNDSHFILNNLCSVPPTKAVLTVIKHVVNDNVVPGTATASNFTIRVKNPSDVDVGNGGNGISSPTSGAEAPGKDFVITPAAGNYTVSENPFAGYTQTGMSCVNKTDNLTLGSSFPIVAGKSYLCTITNNDNVPQPTLKLVKTVTNNDGGQATSANFQGKIDTVNVAWSTPKAVSAGIHTASETNLAGYSAGVWGGDCAADGSITLALGENKTCTITNDDIQPKLTVTKVVVIDNGGTKVISDFPLFVDAISVVSGAQNGFNAGAHTVSETTDPGYTSVISGDCAANGIITLAVGDEKSCTITNNDKAGTLIVKKVLPNDNGGLTNPEDFSFTVNGGNSESFDNDGQNEITINAGTYTVVEVGTPIPGYSTNYNDCEDIEIANGETKICTITNDDQPASLTVIKLVENDDSRSTSEVEDFNLFVDATQVLSGISQFFNVGIYSITEQGNTLGDYNATFTAGDCDSEDGSITLALGETKTCTITNNDKEPGVLHVIKNVENDNPEEYKGTASPEDFTISVSGGHPTPSSFDGSEVGTDVIIDAGASFNVSETDGPLEGYGMEMEGTCSSIMPEGGELTCVITNNDNPPTTGGLTVVKEVITDNGGTKLISDFPLHVTDELLAVTNVASGENNQFAAGNYVISEDDDANYTSTFSESCAGGNITLVNGESKTCTITNDDKAPSLTLVKEIVNDNGGTLEESEVTLTASGPTGFSGVGPSVSNGESFDAGTYTLSETSGLTGYTAGSWSCSGVENVGDQVTLSLDQSATCTITNDDVAPSLTLTKIVDDELGGDASPSDWELTATGPTTISDEGSVSSGPDFKAGIYTLSESTGPANYNPTFWQCNGGTLNGDQLTLALGQSASCTIINTYTPIVYQCSDDEDNSDEEDNLSDENDPGCHSDRDVNNSNSYVPTDDSESNVATECSDGVNNNDVDNLVDSNDPACHTDGDATDQDEVSSYDPDDNDESTECSDGVDNSDGEDELSDANDPGCHSDGNADNEESYNPNDPSESNNSLLQCSDGIDNDDDGKIDFQDNGDPGCNSPSDNDETDSGGGGGSSSGSRIPQGQVLGATTAICNWDVSTYMRRGYKNNSSQVKILQNDLLNGYMKAALVIDGIFGPKTEAVVSAFQLAHKDKVLAPWGISTPTGIFYKTTLVEAKNIMCPTVTLPIPTDLIPWSANTLQVPPKA